MRKIIALGAGAIGRGFLPWALDLSEYELIFVDSDPALIKQLRERGKFTTHISRHGHLESRVVKVGNVFTPEEFEAAGPLDVNAVMMSVGPRNCVAASRCLRKLKAPVILCENDPNLVEDVRAVLDRNNVYFAIPDVISSCTASPQNLRKDPLSIHTEDGILFIDKRAGKFSGKTQLCSELELKQQWAAKLFLHNTTHCIAAYLGALTGRKYLHESMADPEIHRIVSGAMREMLTALKLQWEIPHKFLEWYAAKELRRFSDGLLYDPISRVAREPLRKLDLNGRLIGAAQMCLALGFVPKNVLTGIVSAILFDDAKDKDCHLSFLRATLEPDLLLTYILGLRKGEVLESVLRENYSGIVGRIEKLSAKGRHQCKF